jgi:hypothetical protein
VIPLIGLNSIKGKISKEISERIKEFEQVVHLSPFGLMRGLVFKHLKHTDIIISLSIYGLERTLIISESIFDCLKFYKKINIIIILNYQALGNFKVFNFSKENLEVL